MDEKFSDLSATVVDGSGPWRPPGNDNAGTDSSEHGPGRNSEPAGEFDKTQLGMPLPESWERPGQLLDDEGDAAGPVVAETRPKKPIGKVDRPPAVTFTQPKRSPSAASLDQTLIVDRPPELQLPPNFPHPEPEAAAASALAAKTPSKARIALALLVLCAGGYAGFTWLQGQSDSVSLAAETASDGEVAEQAAPSQVEAQARKQAHQTASAALLPNERAAKPQPRKLAESTMRPEAAPEPSTRAEAVALSTAEGARTAPKPLHQPRAPSEGANDAPSRPTASVPVPAKAAPEPMEPARPTKPPRAIKPARRAAKALPASRMRRPPRASVARYPFSPDEQFSVETAPGFSTDIILQPGEALAAHPTAGDSARWAISVKHSELFGGKQQTHVFVRPLRPGLNTSLTLNTNRRTYLLHLTSGTGRYMPAVRWSYPLEAARARRQESKRLRDAAPAPTDIQDISALRCVYALTTTTGNPAWAPRSVCDDGHKTFIQFAFQLTRKTAPLVVVQQTGHLRAAKFINVGLEGDMLVVHGTFDVAELRKNIRRKDGSLQEQVIRITRSPAKSARR